MCHSVSGGLSSWGCSVEKNLYNPLRFRRSSSVSLLATRRLCFRKHGGMGLDTCRLCFRKHGGMGLDMLCLRKHGGMGLDIETMSSMS